MEWIFFSPIVVFCELLLVKKNKKTIYFKYRMGKYEADNPKAGMWEAVLFVDKNSYRYWLVLGACGALVYYFVTRSVLSPVFAFLTIFSAGMMSLVTDFCYYILGIMYYDPAVTVVRGYATSSYFNDTLHSVGLDYGFNYYNGNYKKSRTQAQLDKFEYAVKQLGIEKGDRVIDVGCGCGDWLYYLQNTMKCKVVGVNITDAQAEQARKRGLTIFTTDWKHIKNNDELKKLLYEQFDCVSFWDTVEHYVPFGFGIWNRKGRREIYQDMFTLAKNLIDKKSTKQAVWISCLHCRFEICPKDFITSKLLCPKEQPKPVKGKPKGKLDANPTSAVNDWSASRSMWKWYCIYLLDKFHSGFYPSYYSENGKFHDELVDNGEAVGFELTWREDTTMDYYMTSKLNPTHFGRHRFNLTPARLLGAFFMTLLDPYWVHRGLWYTVEAWMEQFEPDNIEQSMTILWWLVFKLKSQEKPKPTQNGVTN